MISLPSKWLRKNNLGKGDDITLNESGNELVINTEQISKEKQKETIDIQGLYPLINRKLRALYIKGIDELEINFEKSEDIEDFQKNVINEFLGFEVIKHTQNTIFIKDITGVSDTDIDELIRRIFLILDSMFEELILGLTKKHSMKPVIETDSSINKFVNFSLRLLNKKAYKDFSKTPQIYTILSQLEEVGDTLKSIAKEFEKNKDISKNQISILSEIRNLSNQLKELFFKFNQENAVDFSKKFESIKKKVSRKNSIDCYLYDLSLSVVKIINHIFVIND